MLVLPVSFSAQSATAADESREASMAAARVSVPARWRNYALSSITPRFSWVVQSELADIPQVTDATQVSTSVAFALTFVDSSPIAYLGFSVAREVVDDRVAVLALPPSDLAAELPRVGLQRTIVAPSYVRNWGETGSFGITAVLAYQRFASLGLGEVSLRDDALVWPTMVGESSYGGGLRIDAGNRLGDRLDWNIAYQSRVNMDALKSYRGVYSDPGQFDIPGSANFGVSYLLTPALSFDVGAQRVMYSEVTPFTSSALPRRFLALLGSGASPVFAWQDLTVYSAGWTLRDAAVGNIELRYTTRQQPSPTSALLRSALDADPADHTIALGYARATGRNARISVQVVYSSAGYFLGVPSNRARSDTGGDSVEFEALWALRF